MCVNLAVYGTCMAGVVCVKRPCCVCYNFGLAIFFRVFAPFYARRTYVCCEQVGVVNALLLLVVVKELSL